MGAVDELLPNAMLDSMQVFSFYYTKILFILEYSQFFFFFLLFNDNSIFCFNLRFLNVLSTYLT